MSLLLGLSKIHVLPMQTKNLQTIVFIIDNWQLGSHSIEEQILRVGTGFEQLN